VTVPVNKQWITAVIADDRFTDGEARALIRIGMVSANYTTLEFQVRQSTVAESSCVDRSTVSRALRKAEEHGYIVLLNGSQSGRSRTAANRYRLALPDTRPRAAVHTVEEEPRAAVHRPCAPVHRPCAEPTPLPAETSTPNRSLKRVLDEGSSAAGAAPPPEPSRTCKDHPGGTDRPCGACGTARKENDAWKTEQAQHVKAAGVQRRQLIADCHMCDENGMRELPDDTLARCDHQGTPPTVSATNGHHHDTPMSNNQFLSKLTQFMETKK